MWEEDNGVKEMSTIRMVVDTTMGPPDQLRTSLSLSPPPGASLSVGSRESGRVIGGLGKYTSQYCRLLARKHDTTLSSKKLSKRESLQTVQILLK